MTAATLLRKLRSLHACDDAVAWLKSTDHATLQDAWNACERPDWMLWLLHKLDCDDHLMVHLACDCAETAQEHWLAKYPKDDRPAEAIRVARRWADGTATEAERAAARAAAWDAAWAAAWDAAGAAAGYAAWAAAGDAAGAAAWAAAGYAARAASLKGMAALIRKRVPNPEEVSS